MMDRFAEHRDRLDPPGAAAHVPGWGNARRLEVIEISDEDSDENIPDDEV